MVAADKADPAMQPPVDQVQVQAFPTGPPPQKAEIPADDEGILGAQRPGAAQQLLAVAVQVPRHVQHPPSDSFPRWGGPPCGSSLLCPLPPCFPPPPSQKRRSCRPGRKVFHKNRVFHQEYTIPDPRGARRIFPGLFTLFRLQAGPGRRIIRYIAGRHRHCIAARRGVHFQRYTVVYPLQYLFAKLVQISMRGRVVHAVCAKRILQNVYEYSTLKVLKTLLKLLKTFRFFQNVSFRPVFAPQGPQQIVD